MWRNARTDGKAAASDCYAHQSSISDTGTAAAAPGLTSFKPSKQSLKYVISGGSTYRHFLFGHQEISTSSSLDVVSSRIIHGSNIITGWEQVRYCIFLKRWPIKEALKYDLTTSIVKYVINMPKKNKREAPFFTRRNSISLYLWQLKSTTLSSRSEDWCKFFDNE